MPYKSRWSIDIPKCSLPTFLFHSRSHDLGNDMALIDATRPETHYFTRSDYRLWAQRLGLGLTRSKYFKRGDRVLLFSPNDLFVPVVFMGVLCAGGIFTGANPSFVPRELAHQLKDSGATYLICADVSIDTGIEAAKQAGMGLDRVFVFNDGVFEGPGAPGTQSVKGCAYWGDLLAPANEAKHYAWDDLQGHEEWHTTLALNYSSGTTGVPKGVEISHYNYISNTVQVAQMAQNHRDYATKNKRARWLCFLPLYHAYGQTYYVVGGFNRGIPVYVMKKFDLIHMLEYVQKFRITDLNLVPPIAVALAKHPAVSTYDLSSVEQLGCGAAPLGEEVAQQVERRLGLNMRQGWGMTECTCSALGWDMNRMSYSFSAGEPNANCEAKIMSEDGLQEITGRGSPNRGELWIKGPNVMKGYWNNPSATANTLTPDAWLKTGDIAYVDEYGHFFIVDRIKELIKVKGNQVAPAELEALLLEHPAILDVAVIGIQTEDGDEKPKAFVVLQPDATSKKTTPEEIVKFVENKVIRYKRLAGGVEFVDSIPKNPSGKILRRQLRDQARAKSKSKSDGQAQAKL